MVTVKPDLNESVTLDFSTHFLKVHLFYKGETNLNTTDSYFLIEKIYAFLSSVPSIYECELHLPKGKITFNS